jgi:hypothetical protein
MAGTAQVSSRNRGKKDPVFVSITGDLKYGFQRGANAASQGGALGHTAYTGQTGVFFGANSPKPNRATLHSATKSVSSFIDPGKEGSARQAGWIITRNSKRRGAGQSAKTVSVYVDMPGGYRYAWRMTKADFNAVKTELGLTQATGSEGDLVWGSSPKPPRATKVENGSATSSFIAPKGSVIDAASAKNWSISGVIGLVAEGP